MSGLAAITRCLDSRRPGVWPKILLSLLTLSTRSLQMMLAMSKSAVQACSVKAVFCAARRRTISRSSAGTWTVIVGESGRPYKFRQPQQRGPPRQRLPGKGEDAPPNGFVLGPAT